MWREEDGDAMEAQSGFKMPRRLELRPSCFGPLGTSVAAVWLDGVLVAPVTSVRHSLQAPAGFCNCD